MDQAASSSTSSAYWPHAIDTSTPYGRVRVTLKVEQFVFSRQFVHRVFELADDQGSRAEVRLT